MPQTELKLVDALALDRNKLAAERTLMAWVRTALSMISFGFTIYKFLQVIDEQTTVPVLRPNAPRNLDSCSPVSGPLWWSSLLFSIGAT